MNLKAEIVNKIGKMMPIIKKGWGSRTRLKFGYSNRNAMIKPKKVPAKNNCKILRREIDVVCLMPYHNIPIKTSIMALTIISMTKWGRWKIGKFQTPIRVVSVSAIKSILKSNIAKMMKKGI
ncbi:hypothetical protein [Sporosarcina sp. FSL K6-3457]|uniref:hypothetical protein n=1 Tax=Sporosarcina sp. FSL K6-3457 TaxID=2978204 RepID=UPI0030F552A0